MDLSFETRKVRYADLEIARGTFFSSTSGTSEYGLFMHEHLTAAFPGGLPATAPAPTGKGWKERLDRHVEHLPARLESLPTAERVHEILRSEVLYHELRHLHDAFGTWWGLGLFARYVAVMQDFMALLGRLRDRGEAALPLAAWCRQPEAPAEVRAFVDAVRAYDLEQRIARCAFSLPWQAGPAPEADIVVLAVEDLGIELPAFAVTADRVVIEDGRVTGSVRGHKIVPIGLEVILEGIARQIQNVRITTLYGIDALEAVEQRLRTHTFEDGEAADDAALLPYAISDFLYTKILAKRGFREGDFAGSLLAISDCALMPLDTDVSVPLGMTVASRSVHPGWRFVEALQASKIDDESPRPRLVVATPSARNWCAAMHESLEHRTPASPPPSFADYIEWHALRRLAIPLLEIRKELGDRAFVDPGVYAALQPQLPKPEFVLVDGGLIRFSDGTADSTRAWVAWAILDQIMHDMLHGGVALCARRDKSKLFPYVRGTSFNAPPLDCRVELEHGCGWYGFDGDTAHLPACQFRRFLAGVGLDGLRVRAAAG